jgi:hypothetical protein
MRTILRRRPSPAMIVACTALLVALSGTAVATVATVPRGSVGTLNLKNNAVTSAKIRNGQVATADIRNNAVTTTKVRDGSLLAVDFAPGQLGGGAPGPKGEKGEKGDKGDPGLVGQITVRTANVVVGGGVAENGAYSTRAVSRNCDSDERAISAGTGWSDTVDDLELVTVQVKPVLNGGNVVGYEARGGNDSGNTSTFTLYVLCYKT